MRAMSPSDADETKVEIPVEGLILHGCLAVPKAPHVARGIVVFAHGSGSGRHSPRNRRVAASLQEHGYATLLFDLLTLEEEQVDYVTAHLRFNVDLLSERLMRVTQWVAEQPSLGKLDLAYFGASTGAAAALIAAGRLGERIAAVISRGGRPDLAGDALAQVTAPTLLVVGELDETVLELNRRSANRMLRSEACVVPIPGASHLFEEPGALDRVSALAATWLDEHLELTASPLEGARRPARPDLGHHA